MSIPSQQPLSASAKLSVLDLLERDGYAVVPRIIPVADCDAFVEAALSWLEAFPNGFKRGDKSTWTAECLPHSIKCVTYLARLTGRGGMYGKYGVSHEDFVWKIRS